MSDAGLARVFRVGRTDGASAPPCPSCRVLRPTSRCGGHARAFGHSLLKRRFVSQVVNTTDKYEGTAAAPTMSTLLDADDPVAVVRSALATAPRIGDLADILANSAHDATDPSRPWLLCPVDLQAVKASGVTFVASLLERVIEEQARGDPARAKAIRGRVDELVGGDLSEIRPGSDSAARLKDLL